MSDIDIVEKLATRLDDTGSRTRLHDTYYDGDKRLAALGLSLPPEMRQLQIVVNWPRLTVDALENRINVQGFRMGKTDEPDDRLWSWWQLNNLDEEAPLGHLESFVQGRAFVVVGFDEEREDVPLITVESARNMVVDLDNRRRVTAGVRLYEHDVAGAPQAATLYLPERTAYFIRDRGRWIANPDLPAFEHGYGRAPIVPIVNRARLHDRTGRSEMSDVMDLTDGCCRTLTNLQGAQELMAVPSRYVFGVTEDDMTDQNGDRVPKWEAYIGRFNTIADPEAKVVQLPGADLRNFTEVINSYARLVSSVTGMPSHYLGLTSENPASADAIRSAEARHVARAERKCQALSGAWEEVMRLGMLIVDGEVPDEAQRMETVFADPATPTYAAKVDGVVKLVQVGLLPKEAAWEELGYSQEKRRRLASMQDDDALSQLVRSVNADRAATTNTTPVEGLEQVTT